VFAAYGLGMGLVRRRALFVVDARGWIAYAQVHRLGLDYERVDTIAEVLRSLPGRDAYPDEGDPTETPKRAGNVNG
jgi:hypothetical protein